MTRLIVVDATPYGPGMSGARRRCEELLQRLPALLPDDVFEVHWAHDGGGPSRSIEADNLVHATVDVSCRGGARRWMRRARDLKRRHAQAPFTDLFTDHGPVVYPRRVRNLVTLHDLRFLHGYGGTLRALYGRFRYGAVLRRAAAVIAVSRSVGDEATRTYDLDARRVLVAANAAADVFRQPPAESVRRGALVVGRDEPRKARGAAVAAAREAGVALEIVDGEIDDMTLAAKYGAAQWLLAPSLLEGFDLPVVEALACGTPVIASDIGPHRDLVDAGAQGITLAGVPANNGAWNWPAAVAALRERPPLTAAPPPDTWDDAAEAIAGLFSSSPERAQS